VVTNKSLSNGPQMHHRWGNQLCELLVSQLYSSFVCEYYGEIINGLPKLLRYTVHGMCGGSGAWLCDLLSGLTTTVTVIKLAGTDLSHWFHYTASIVLPSTKYFVHQRAWVHESWSRCSNISTAIGLNTSNSRQFRHNHEQFRFGPIKACSCC
jgi:hypothetical protein